MQDLHLGQQTELNLLHSITLQPGMTVPAFSRTALGAVGAIEENHTLVFFANSFLQRLRKVVPWHLSLHLKRNNAL